VGSQHLVAVPHRVPLCRASGLACRRSYCQPSVRVLCACVAPLCFAFPCSPAAFLCCVILCGPVVSCVLSGVLLRLSPRHNWCHLCLFFCVLCLRTPPTAVFDVRCRLVLSLVVRCVAAQADAARASNAYRAFHPHIRPPHPCFRASALRRFALQGNERMGVITQRMSMHIGTRIPRVSLTNTEQLLGIKKRFSNIGLICAACACYEAQMGTFE
jgi:hypothetical protein